MIKRIGAFGILIGLLGGGHLAVAQEADLSDAELAALIGAELNARSDLADVEIDLSETRAGRGREMVESRHAADKENRAIVEKSEAGVCDNPLTDVFENCPVKGSEYSFGSVIVPRQAAPFQAQIVYSDWAVRQASYIQSRPDLLPWQKRHICGGTLIAPDWVVTAAHCLKSPSASVYGVRLDVGNIESDVAPIVPVKAYVIHPCYNPATLHNDVALLRLDRSRLNLAIEPSSYSVEYATAVADYDGVIKAVAFLDDNHALIHLSEGGLSVLNFATGQRELLPGSSDPEMQVVVGTGFGLQWAGSDYWLHMSSDQRPARQSYSEAIRAMDYDPDGGRLLIAGQGGLITLNSTDRRSPFTIRVDAEPLKAVLLDETRVRISLRNGTDEVWDVRRGQKRLTFPTTWKSLSGTVHGFEGVPHYVMREAADTMIRDRALFYEDDHTLIEKDGVISIADHDSGKISEVARTTLLFPLISRSPDGRRLVVLGRKAGLPEGHGEIWDIRRSRILSTFMTDPGFTDSTPRFTDDGKQFVLWNTDGLTDVRETKTGARVMRFNHSVPVNTGRLTRDNRIMVRSDLGTAEVWDIDTGQAKARIFHGRHLGGSHLHGEQFLTWSRTGRIRLWDATSAQQLLHFILSERGDVSSLSASDNDIDAARVSLIDLASASGVDEMPDDISAIGWGKVTKSSNAPPSAALRLLSLSPIDWGDCIQRVVDAGGRISATFQDPNAFCAIGAARKTCTGDSGGPVIGAGKLVGLVSRGSGVCKDDGQPTTFVTMARYRGWIQGQVCPTQARRPQHSAGMSNALADGTDALDPAYPEFCLGWTPPPAGQTILACPRQ